MARHKEDKEMQREEKRLKLLEQGATVRHPTPKPGHFHSERKKWKFNRSRGAVAEDFIEEDEDLIPFWEENGDQDSE